MTPHPVTQVRRLPENAVNDRSVLREILQSAMLAHVGFVVDGYPYVVPLACAPWSRQDDELGLLFHGSTGSRLFRALAAGTPACATVTHLDALVLARSAFESSMNYRSAMIMGTAVELTGDTKAAGLAAITDHLLPGRRQELRRTNPKEAAATMVLGLPATHWSVKVSSGGPDDPQDDIEATPHLWAGSVPVVTNYGEPVPDDFSRDVAAPGYIENWPLNSTTR